MSHAQHTQTYILGMRLGGVLEVKMQKCGDVADGHARLGKVWLATVTDD